MKRNYAILIAATLLMGACSAGKNSVEEAFKNLPSPTMEANELDIYPQNIGGDVPTTLSGVSYYGKYDLKIGETQQFTLKESTQGKVFDLEIKSDVDKTFVIDQFYNFSVGSCSEKETHLSWIETSLTGQILSEDTLDLTTSIVVEANRRYLLRVNYVKTIGCSQIVTSLTTTQL